MPLWLFIFLIIIADIAGSLIGSFAVFAWALYVLNKPKGSRRSR